MRHLAFAFLLLGAATAVAGPVDDVLEEARENCVRFEDGTFEPRDAVQRVDLTGDGMPEQWSMSPASHAPQQASMYCGSGGCMVRAIVDDQTFS